MFKVYLDKQTAGVSKYTTRNRPLFSAPNVIHTLMINSWLICAYVTMETQVIQIKTHMANLHVHANTDVRRGSRSPLITDPVWMNARLTDPPGRVLNRELLR